MSAALIPGTPLAALPVFECGRCGHSWSPRKPEVPLRCAGCQSPYWNRERKYAQAGSKTANPSGRKPKTQNKKG